MNNKILSPQDKLAKILRTDKDFISKVESRLSAVTGRKQVMEKIIGENEVQIADHLLTLGVSESASAKEVYDALISKIEADDSAIFESMGRPVCKKHEDCNRVLEMAKKTVPEKRGFFLKKDKALEFLHKEPPKKVMQYLGYDSVDEMLRREDLFEVYCALRFVEGNEWLNGTFFKQYEDLTPNDFEEREIVAKALPPKWNETAESFLLKKHHNISHLKELGVVFVIPATLGISGELLRMMSLIFHYFREIPFYSDMFKQIAEMPTTFSSNFISLLRGDVIDRRMPEVEKSLWLVVQRYLAKDDENEWRLFVPHINPEALHWERAEEDLVKMGSLFDGFGPQLAFWRDLDWVGDYFLDEVGSHVLVSFDLVDTVMSLVKRKEMSKYLYHHQEALWNKIFIEYFSLEELEKFSKEYLLQGYFEI